MLTTVVFDADHTLVDLRPAVEGALRAVLREAQRLGAAGLTLADLEADWLATFAAMPAEPVTEIRRTALAASLARCGLGAHIDAMLTLFYARRFELSRPFPAALPMLAALRGRYTLGLASNGNSEAARCGLGGQFAFELYAHRGGLPKKPAPAFYATVIAASGAPAASIVHVGDNVEHDVVGPQAAGLRGVWLNPAGLPVPCGVTPDAQVRDLAEIPGVLEQMARE